MSEVLRCPDCGASNQIGAPWCGQCLRRLDGSPSPAKPEQVAEPPRVAEPEYVAEPELAGTPESAEPGQPPRLAAVPATGRGVRREGDAVVWTCPACENENPVDLLNCSVCGTALATLFRTESETSEPPRNPGSALALSAVLPGAGHFSIGFAGAGVARVVLWGWSLAVGLYLTFRDVRRNAALVHGLGAVFLLAAAGVWVLSIAEVARISRGERSLIAGGRSLTWATAGLTFLLFAGLAAVVQAR